MVILFDFDEVFVDLNTGALKYINNKNGTKYTMDDVTSWEFFDKPDVREPFYEYLSLPDVYQSHVIPNKQMISILKQMVEMGMKAYIVTASVESSQESKYKFIKENMPFFDTKNLFTVNNSSKYKMKSDVLDEIQLNYHEPIILVDDGIHNVLDMMADIKHKSKLDDIMKKFYINRTLKKFNNPYHEFIYGIIPELTYNKEINDGKRIFKIKESKEIWKVIDKIKNQHTSRVENKQAEIFNYMNNILNDLLPSDFFKESSELQNNAGYMTKHILSKTNPHSNFLSEISRLSIKVEKIIEPLHQSYTFKKTDINFSKNVIDSIFEASDKKFGNEILYSEVKSLVLLHGIKTIEEHHKANGMTIGELYGINEKQMDLFTTSLLGEIIAIAKTNLLATKKIIKDSYSDSEKALINDLLQKTGTSNEPNFEDLISLSADVSLAFNKNYTLGENQKHIIIKNKDVEKIKQSFLEIEKQPDLFFSKFKP